jgi:transglutaminase-like putative cysteine protease
MRYEIDHLTLYRYSVPVELGEHLLRFLPMLRDGQQPGYCELSIDPLPLRSEEIVDPWGNRALRVQFAGQTDRLEIRAHLEVQTSHPASGFVPDFPLPAFYGADSVSLAPYLASIDDPAEDPYALDAFVAPLASAAAGSGTAFLQALNQAVHGFYQHGIRVDGPPRSAVQTLARREGVCRDLSVLFMAACRHMGLASRFVSGYQGEGRLEVRFLHAWPEVYLPGRGWTGFDPTHATVVGADHVAIAAAPSADLVTPVEGGYSFQGPELRSTLDTDIRISTC